MEQISLKSPRIRRSHHQILDLLLEYEKSRVAVKEFCSVHSISKATFHKWQSRYKTGKEQSSKQTGFAPLQIIPSAGSVQSALFAEVNGIKIYQRVDASYLKALLK